MLVGLLTGGAAGALLLTTPAGAGVLTAAADQLTVWTSPPDPDDVALADAIGFTAEGERIFFASRPEVESAARFNEDCPAEGSIVLGCYTRGRIYVYEVTDERLAGTNEVTAAHEMLHAAYERLGDDERARVDALVSAQIDALPADDPLRATVDAYPADQRLNEFHSRFGTEVEELSPELEEHYARYFTDRSRIYDFYAESNRVLDETRARIDELVSQLDALDAQLTTDQAAYDADVAGLNADIDAFNARASTPGGFVSQAQFDRERAALLARSDTVEQERVTLNANIDRYNALRDELTDLDAGYAELYSHLNSQAAEGEAPAS